MNRFVSLRWGALHANQRELITIQIDCAKLTWWRFITLSFTFHKCLIFSRNFPSSFQKLESTLHSWFACFCRRYGCERMRRSIKDFHIAALKIQACRNQIQNSFGKSPTSVEDKTAAESSKNLSGGKKQKADTSWYQQSKVVWVHYVLNCGWLMRDSHVKVQFRSFNLHTLTTHLLLLV